MDGLKERFVSLSRAAASAWTGRSPEPVETPSLPAPFRFAKEMTSAEQRTFLKLLNEGLQDAEARSAFQFVARHARQIVLGFSHDSKRSFYGARAVTPATQDDGYYGFFIHTGGERAYLVQSIARELVNFKMDVSFLQKRAENRVGHRDELKVAGLTIQLPMLRQALATEPKLAGVRLLTDEGTGFEIRDQKAVYQITLHRLNQSETYERLPCLRWQARRSDEAFRPMTPADFDKAADRLAQVVRTLDEMGAVIWNPSVREKYAGAFASEAGMKKALQTLFRETARFAPLFSSVSVIRGTPSSIKIRPRLIPADERLERPECLSGYTLDVGGVLMRGDDRHGFEVRRAGDVWAEMNKDELAFFHQTLSRLVSAEEKRRAPDFWAVLENRLMGKAAPHVCSRAGRAI